MNLYKHGICLPPPVVKEILKNHCSSKCPCKTAQSVGYYQILYKFSLSFDTTCSRHLPSFLINFPWKEHYFELTILTGCPKLEAVILTAVARGWHFWCVGTFHSWFADTNGVLLQVCVSEREELENNHVSYLGEGATCPLPSSFLQAATVLVWPAALLEQVSQKVLILADFCLGLTIGVFAANTVWQPRDGCKRCRQRLSAVLLLRKTWIWATYTQPSFENTVPS